MSVSLWKSLSWPWILKVKICLALVNRSVGEGKAWKWQIQYYMVKMVWWGGKDRMLWGHKKSRVWEKGKGISGRRNSISKAVRSELIEHFRSLFLKLPCSIDCNPPAAALQPSGPPEQLLPVERAVPGSGKGVPHLLVEEENTLQNAQVWKAVCSQSSSPAQTMLSSVSLPATQLWRHHLTFLSLSPHPIGIVLHIPCLGTNIWI